MQPSPEFVSPLSTQSPGSSRPALSALSRREALRYFGAAGAAALFAPALARAAVDPAIAPAAAVGAPVVPSLTGAQPGFYRFKIGALEALAINDGGFSAPADKSPFGVGEPTEKVVASLKAALLPTDKVWLPFNVLLVRIGAELVMIDAGAGSAFGIAGGRLVPALAMAGVLPEQITGIIVSHMHGDHFGGLLTKDGTPVFKNATLFIHRAEHAHWSDAKDANVDKYLKAFEGKWQLIGGGEKLLESLEIMETFGHTPGHISVAITSGSEQLFHLVDVVHHHALSFAHPEWVMKFDSQSDIAIATRKRILDRVAADGSRLFGAHLPFPTLGRARRVGNAYEFVPEPWSWM